eukprot:4162702-Pyramimonas_sp.AAC.1
MDGGHVCMLEHTQGICMLTTQGGAGKTLKLEYTAPSHGTAPCPRTHGHDDVAPSHWSPNNP